MIRSASGLCALLLLLSAAALAQREGDPSLPGTTLEISGQVRAAGGQKSAANVMVRLERFGGGLVDQTATDGTGQFRFASLAAGQYVVTARADGLAARTSQIDLGRAFPRQHVILQLEPEESAFRTPRAKAATVDSRVPPEARREFEKGMEARRGRREDEAVRHLENAVRLHPDFKEAHLALADAHLDARRWGEAERALRRALALGPKTPETLVTLGEALRRQKKFGEAEAALIEGLRLERGSWRGHFTLGRVYWETNEVLKAAPHVGQALKINPTFAEGHLLAGNIFVRLSMPEHAVASYEEYLRLAPDGEFATLTEENLRKLKQTLPAKR